MMYTLIQSMILGVLWYLIHSHVEKFFFDAIFESKNQKFSLRSVSHARKLEKKQTDTETENK